MVESQPTQEHMANEGMEMTQLVKLLASKLITAYISAFCSYRQESRVCIDHYFIGNDDK